MTSNQIHANGADFRFDRAEDGKAVFVPIDTRKKGNPFYDFAAAGDELIDRLGKRVETVQRYEEALSGELGIAPLGGQLLGIIAEERLPIERGNIQALRRGLDALGIAE